MAGRKHAREGQAARFASPLTHMARAAMRSAVSLSLDHLAGRTISSTLPLDADPDGLATAGLAIFQPAAEVTWMGKAASCIRDGRAHSRCALSLKTVR